jgi:hypothetical protein
VKTNLKSQILNLKSQISTFGVLFLFVAGSLAFAADPPSTDDQLRDSLNSKTDDDYDRALLGDRAKPDDKDRVGAAMQKKLDKELGAAAQQEDKPKDPLLQVAEEMREARQLLEKHEAGVETQHLQVQIVSDLDKLIEQAKKSGSCKGGADAKGPKQTASGKGKPGQAPGQPPATPSSRAQESDPNHVKTDHRDAAAASAGDLLERFRATLQERKGAPLLEEPSEYFLPEYKLEIEDYFRRLSGDRRKP